MHTKLKLPALFITLAATLPGRAADVGVLAGPMVGHVTDRSARVWMQLDLAGQMSLRVIDADTNQPVSGLDFPVDGPSPFIVDVPLNNLTPDHTYRLECQFEGKPMKMPGPPLVIRTAPAAGDEAIFSIAFGSDLYEPATPLDMATDMPDAVKPGNAPIFKRITELKPRAFFFLGDTGFLPAKLEDFPATRRPAFRAIWQMHAQARRDPDLQELFRTTPCYGLFNDRDFGTPNADGSFVYKTESLVAFQRFWPNPEWGNPVHPGCYCGFSLGDADFFFLDVRTYRAAPAMPATAPAIAPPPMPAMLGDTQLQWLEDNLKKSRATFKVIAAPCVLFGTGAGGWSQFPAEQHAFIQWLGANQIGGVLALAGDRPAGEMTGIDPKKSPAANPLAYPLFTLGTSTLNDVPKTVRNAAVSAPDPARIGDIVLQNNFGTLDFGGQGEHRFVTLRLRDETGKARAEQTVFATQLRQ